MAEKQNINTLTWKMLRAEDDDERNVLVAQMDEETKKAVLQKMADLSLEMVAAGDLDWYVLGNFLVDVMFESGDPEKFANELDDEHRALLHTIMLFRALEFIGTTQEKDKMRAWHWALLAVAIIIVVVTLVVFWL